MMSTETLPPHNWLQKAVCLPFLLIFLFSMEIYSQYYGLCSFCVLLSFCLIIAFWFVVHYFQAVYVYIPPVSRHNSGGCYFGAGQAWGHAVAQLFLKHKSVQNQFKQKKNSEAQVILFTQLFLLAFLSTSWVHFWTRKLRICELKNCILFVCIINKKNFTSSMEVLSNRLSIHDPTRLKEWTKQHPQAYHEGWNGLMDGWLVDRKHFFHWLPVH